MVDATLAWSLLAGVWNPRVFLGSRFKRNGGQVGSSWEVLSQEPICIFIRSTLLGTLWIAEVDLHIRGYRKLLVLGHLQPAIPGQRAAQGRRKFTNVFAQRRHDHRPIFAPHLDQHEKA